MTEKRVVFDFHDTLVAKPLLFPREFTWMPGRIELLNELRLLGWSIVVWTADRLNSFEKTNRSLSPALLGIARGGITDEFYCSEKIPEIPRSYDPPYTDADTIEYANYLSSYYPDDPHFDVKNLSINGQIYEDRSDFMAAARKHLLVHDMHLGWKFPPIVTSSILVDDMVDTAHPSSLTLRRYARLFRFNLVDPKLQPGEKKGNQWIDRMVRSINSASGS